MKAVWARCMLLWPGLLVCSTVALAAMFLAEHHGAPVMLLALLLGMALNFLSQTESGQAGRCAAGIDFGAKTVLRIGVTLLGLRITLEQVMALGWAPIAMVLLAVVLTIAVGIALARLFGFQMFFGLLTGGAVAICGASAALAISAALPAHPRKEQATLFTVIGVSTLSTLAMVVYPMVTEWLSLSPWQAGAFMGGTIHDVAQVVGAGYSISQEAGDVATLVKLMRVAMLVPVIAVAAWLAQRHTAGLARAAEGPRPPLLPWFALAFALLVGINSSGWLPAALVRSGQGASQWCLVLAMTAIGMKTQLRDMVRVGWKPVALMMLETSFLAGLFYILLSVSAKA